MAARRSRLGLAAVLASLVPVAWLGVRAATGGLSANPIADVLNFLGKWALILLLASLACTPLRQVFGWSWPMRVRKTLGLAAFFYACAHLAFYVGVDQFFDVSEIASDVAKRKFITVGLAAFLLLVPLAITSRQAWKRRLGGVRWARLHRLVYPAAGLAVVHFVWRVKGWQLEPFVYAGILALLFAIRFVTWVRKRAAEASVS